jgi:Mn2+/Fe2+ NRAMP family transporter
MAGASFGYGLLWTALLSLPLMISVQMMCGRLGMVTGRGLAGVLGMRYPRWVPWGPCAILITANVINIAADLGGMAQGAQLVTGVKVLVWIPAFALVITAFLIWSSYRTIARIKWLTLLLLAYVGTAFLAHVDWSEAVAATFVLMIPPRPCC